MRKCCACTPICTVCMFEFVVCLGELALSGAAWAFWHCQSLSNSHLALSGLTIRPLVWPWQQVCLTDVRTTWIFIMTSPVYWLQCGGHTQVRLSGLSELAREEGGSVLIAHMRDIQEFASSRQLDRWKSLTPGKDQMYLLEPMSAKPIASLCESVCQQLPTSYIYARGGWKGGHMTTFSDHIIDGRVAESFTNSVSSRETSLVIFCLKLHYIHH